MTEQEKKIVEEMAAFCERTANEETFRDTVREASKNKAAALRSLLKEFDEKTKDAERLDFIAREYLCIEPFDMPTGQGDANVGWVAKQYRMGMIVPMTVAKVYQDNVRDLIDVTKSHLTPPDGD
jgi:hypothetical protein